MTEDAKEPITVCAVYSCNRKPIRTGLCVVHIWEPRQIPRRQYMSEATMSDTRRKGLELPDLSGDAA